MGKISTYAVDSTPSLSDKLIGTEVGNLDATKNYTISSILSLGNSSGLFVPYTGALGPVTLGVHGITANSFTKAGGTSAQFLKADGSVDSNTYLTPASLTSYVPYTGASTNVNLGSNNITANSFVKVGGTSAQFLKADGSVDSTTYLTSSSLSGLVPYTGAVSSVNLGSNNITANSFIKLGGTSSQFLKADGSVDSTTYATAASVTALAPRYGSFYDTTLQTALAANTAYPMKLNSTDNIATNGFAIGTDGLGNPTVIKASAAGVYNIAFSAQLQRTTGGSSETINIWLKRNGSNLAWTNTSVNVQANAGFLVAAWNFFVQLDAGAEAQLMWATTSTAIQIVTAAATGVHPATPSVILTVNKVG